MKITICAVGRQKPGPERSLTEDYLSRFDRTGRALSLGPAACVEIDDRKGGGPKGEARLLEAACPDGAVRLALDERGKTLSSPDFAALMSDWRDAGRRDLAIFIGGADGLDPGLRAGCDRLLSFGPMVWPHKLARAMLAEQLYRAATILARTPYHRT